LLHCTFQHGKLAVLVLFTGPLMQDGSLSVLFPQLHFSPVTGSHVKP
jgi:hypothetical protein